MASSENTGGFFRNRLRLALNSSNDIISGLSTNLSRLSLFSGASSSSANLDTTANDVEKFEEPALPLHKLPGTPEPMTSPHSSRKSPTTMTEKIKETFKFENLKEFRPTLGDLIAIDSSTEPSTLPTNTPESPRAKFRFKLSSINQSIPKTLEDAKAMAIRTLGGEGKEATQTEQCAIKVDLVEQSCQEGQCSSFVNSRDLENTSTCLSSRSSYSLQASALEGGGAEKSKLASSGTPSEAEGIGHSISMDSTDSDPHKKLWIRSGSQTSLKSWASSLSYDSQTEEVNDIREFMLEFVDDMFKQPHIIDVDRKAEFGRIAQTEMGRLWFARCINAKRCCKCVLEPTFFSLIHHFAIVLFECADADDFSPAKSLMNMCFTYYHEVDSPGGQTKKKEFVYVYLKQQSIWRSIRFWNAAFFDALQCERALRPVLTREEVGKGVKCRDNKGQLLSKGALRDQAVADELHFQENITFGQLGTFTCNMHAFGLSKAMVTEFLRKQVTIASLRSDQVNLLRENVNRMFSDKQEWR